VQRNCRRSQDSGGLHRTGSVAQEEYDKRHARSRCVVGVAGRRSQITGGARRACRCPGGLPRLSPACACLSQPSISPAPLALRCFPSTTSTATAHRLSKHKCARSQLYSPLTACVIGSQLHSVRKRNAGISHSPRRRCAQPPQARSSAQPGRRGACLHPPHNSNINLPASHLLTPCPSSTTAPPARTQPHTPDTHKMAEIRRKLVIVGDGACGKTCLLM
jgi:hypothetical protein